MKLTTGQGKTRVVSSHLIIFSLVWSFGGSLDQQQQLHFDSFFRKEVDTLRFEDLLIINNT